MEYSSLEEIMSELINDINGEIVQDISSEMEKIYAKKAEESYDFYTPKNENTSRYRNGLGGSLADLSNFHSEVEKGVNSLTINTYSDRESDCSCEYCDSNDTHLMYFADEGIAGKFRIPPKSITEKAQEELDNECYRLLDDELKKYGW